MNVDILWSIQTISMAIVNIERETFRLTFSAREYKFNLVEILQSEPKTLLTLK